jgi:hypothetical protein
MSSTPKRIWICPMVLGEMLNLLIDHSFEGMAQATQTLLNEAMKAQ